MWEQVSAEGRDRPMPVSRTVPLAGMDVPWIWEQDRPEGCRMTLRPAALLTILCAGTYVLGKLQDSLCARIKTMMASF